MELTWHNGQIVVQHTRPPPPPQPPPLFIHEDEMASWLHHPLQDDHPFNSNFSSDSLYPAASAVATDPILSTNRLHSNPPIARVPRFVSEGPSNSINELASVVESNVTPEGDVGGDGGVETASFDYFTIGTSTDESLAELDLELLVSDLKKRKALEADDSQDFIRAPTVKRTRAAEVHNLSERKRRDRISDKMKALQELIPRCNKSDKASMLDDAFNYLKSLQMQVQMMSMVCGVVPMMFPGLQQYTHPVEMGLVIEMNHRTMQFPMTTPTHFIPIFPVASYHQPSSPFIPHDPSIQVTNPALMGDPAGTQNVNQQHFQSIPDQYLSYPATNMQPSQSLPEN